MKRRLKTGLAILGTAATLGLMSDPSCGQVIIQQMSAPYRPAATIKNLKALLKETTPGVKFSDAGARNLWRAMYVDCSVFGMNDRYVFYDTLFRTTLLTIRAFSGEKTAHLDVRSTPTGIIVDAITPPNPTHPNTLTVRLAVIDRTGRILRSEFTEDGIEGACRGVQGDIYVDARGLAAGPPG